MDITIQPGLLRGAVDVISSKSQAHRYLICAALAKENTTIICSSTNDDINATADCLRRLGADVRRTSEGFEVSPISGIPATAELNCRESGSTLRFLLPVVGALGIAATIRMAGRLPQRPLSPLWEEMERMGCRLSRPSPDTIVCTGKLKPGHYEIDGGVSSQYISGLLFALPIIGGSRLTITGKIESAPYIEMTRQALALFPDGHSPGEITVEGDWSNGAFWLSANALGSRLQVMQLCNQSAQGDREIAVLLPKLQKSCKIDVSDIPDLVPILSIVACCKHGAVFQNIHRLRLKESDRVASTIALIEGLGGKAEATEDTLTVYGTALVGGTVDACNDHRIAMSAAIASTVCKNEVTILGAECVKKSYPTFWEEFSRLGGNYELYLR